MSRQIFGYAGELLYVDLARGKIQKRQLDLDLARKHIGGSGLAAKIFYDQVPEVIDPLSPNNLLIFASGPLTGTLLPMSGKWAVSAISPLTGIWGEANSGAWWGADLKFAGYDGIVIKGRSENPVYISVDDDSVDLKNAKDLWGLGTSKSMRSLMADHGRDVSVACIGPAGENLVRIASIINEHGGAAARCGLGAVMGSKNLKAIVVRGSREIKIAAPEKFAAFVEAVNTRVRESQSYRDLSRYGTSAWLEASHEIGDLPIKYWKESEWPDGARELSGTTTAKRMPVKGIACFACSVGCGTAVRLAFRSREAEWAFGPEYETLGAFGSLCLNDSFKDVVRASELSNDYGIDTISAGGIIAFTMECFERRLIPKEFLDELDISWGNTNTIFSLLEMIAKRKGLGKILSEGVRRASESFGEEASRIAVHVKGLDPAMHDPRATPGFGLLYATSPIGASHGRGKVSLFDKGEYTPEELARKNVDGQNLMAFVDSAVLCKFGLLMNAFNLADIAEYVTAVTGWETSESDLSKAGERVCNLKRLINLRQGLTAAQDCLPEVFVRTPRTIGRREVVLQNLDEMIRYYYSFRGWDKQGIPTEEKLRELAIIEK